MKGYLVLSEARLGEINFEIIDEGMGVIGGELKPYDAYYKYKDQIQAICETKGIANIDDFNFLISINENIIKNAEGGIGVTDLRSLEEIHVEVAGLSYDIIKLLPKK